MCQIDALAGGDAAAGVGHDVRRDQAQSQPDAERQQDEIIQVAKHRDRVRDEIERAQGVGHDAQRDQPGIPGCAGIAPGQQERAELAFQRPGAIPESSLQEAVIGVTGTFALRITPTVVGS